MVKAGDFKYNNGDVIPPNNILMLERTKRVNNIWFGKFKCPYCDNEFETRINDIRMGNTTSCGCYALEISRENGGKNIKDLTGERFGRLTVVKRIENKDEHAQWLCLCDCGNEVNVISKYLLSGGTTSCGCYRKEIKSKDLTNQRFGRLIAIRPTDKRAATCIVWECKCDCGNTSLVSSNALLFGNTMSCGCIQSKGEAIIANVLNNMSIQHERQKTFENCINPETNMKLYFDFYLPDYNICIEYDGEQHYKRFRWEESDDKLKIRRHRDQIKNQYCKDHDIHLIRVPYWDQNRISKDYILELIASTTKQAQLIV